MFRSVNVALADTAPRSGDSTVRVVVRVSEAPRHRIRLGGGYGSIDCFRFQAGWTAYDFFGGARTLDLTGQLSKIGAGFPTDAGFRRNLCCFLHDDQTSDTANYNATVTLRQPAFLSPRHTASFAVFAERRSEFKAYTRQAVGANFAVTVNARRNVPVTVGYSYSVGRTTADPVVYCSVFRVCNDSDQVFLANRRRFGAITVSGARDQVNSVLDPSSGSAVRLNYAYASRYVFSDSLYEFNRGELEVGEVWERGDTLSPISGVRGTPGLGLRFVTPLGPVRLDAAYNGYAAEPGPLYFQDNSQTPPTLKVTPHTIHPPRPSSFWSRVKLQFAVGQAF